LVHSEAQLNVSENLLDKSLTEIKQEQTERLIKITGRVDVDKKELKDLLGKQQRIRFSSIYFSYKYKFYWPLFDFIALYNNMMVYFVVTLLNIYWWFNLINLL